jgi:signal peptidase I
MKPVRAALLAGFLSALVFVVLGNRQRPALRSRENPAAGDSRARQNVPERPESAGGPGTQSDDHVAVAADSSSVPVDGGVGARRGRFARLLSKAAMPLWLALAVVWFFTLRPVAWGGPAGFNTVSGISMQPTFSGGDLVVTFAQSSYSVGDIVAYHVPAGAAAAGAIVIHRIVGGDPVGGFTTRGDNNRISDPWHPTEADIVGRAWFYVPGAGRMLLSLKTPIGVAATFGLIAAIWFYFAWPMAKKKAPGRGDKLGKRVAIPVRARTRQPIQMGDTQPEPLETVLG